MSALLYALLFFGGCGIASMTIIFARRLFAAVADRIIARDLGSRWP